MTTSFRAFAFLFITSSWVIHLAAQDEIILPKGLAPHEHELIPAYRESRAVQERGITSPPPVPVRTMGEWEEIQTLCITWRSYPVILKQIVRHAKEECEVLIICASSGSDSQASVTNYLLASNAGGPPLANLDNITFQTAASNSVWIRDYGPETMYFNEVDSLVLLDWIYNRPRPGDDAISDVIGTNKNIAVFSTTQAPGDLVHTGGNFMADGFGTGFSSNLVVDENGPAGSFNQTNKNVAQIDAIMDQWMGIQTGRYVKMTTLPYDDIHHIDMHMKLLDEETLLVGEFPAGVSDGPQMEANLQYVLDNYTSVFGTPYEVVRIPMVPSTGGAYPPSGYYRTYANNIFINKTVLVPTYREQYDTTGLRILRETLPGYKVIGIDCDDSGGNIISAGGAIHCITKAIGVSDPLLIRHQRLRDTDDQLSPYQVQAYIRHKSGIASARVHWTMDTTAGFALAEMSALPGNEWIASIPAQPAGSTIYYYIHATANNGKQIARPIVAPEGTWQFRILPGGAGGVPVVLKAFLEGPFEGGAGLMRDDLRTQGLIPLQEPFSTMDFEMTGGEGVSTTAAVLAVSGGQAIVDWVLVELRSAADPTAIVHTRAALIRRDGMIVGANGGELVLDVASGEYYVALRHRNHLGCMTAAPVTLGNPPDTIDLTLASTTTWGTEGRKAVDDLQLLWSGEVVRDGSLRYTGGNNDRDPVLVRVGGVIPTQTLSGYYAEDLNMDGVVRYTGGNNDRDAILQNIGGVVPTSARMEQLP